MNKKGMTLSETLVATLIMLLVSVAMVTGVSLSNKEFVYSIKQSSAQELFSTLETLIINELKYTNKAQINNDNSVGCMWSETYATQGVLPTLVSITYNDGDTTVTDGFGELAFYGKNSSNADVYNKLIGSASYVYNLGAKATIKYEDNVFKVNLSIGTVGEDSAIISKDFVVRPLNFSSSNKVSNCEAGQ